MLNIFWKNFHLCFTKQKSEHEASILPPSPTKQFDTISSATVRHLKNFNSLCDLSSSASTSKSPLSLSSDTDFLPSGSDSNAESPPDFATIFASQRFFFSSPGRSNSIIESPDTRPEPEAESGIETPPLDGGVAVKKYSADPYKDFRFSMQEMIEARNLTKVKDWEFLHELLLCYLTLNPRNTHKFIISAFADIVVCLLSSSSPESDTDSHPKPENHHR